MNKIVFDKPSNTTGEITIIGTGGGYGESCVIHLGNQKWVVIDSCRNPLTKRSLALEYFERIGVNVELDVSLILCTHWHDDHIRGISELFEKCLNASFSFAKTIDKNKFFRLLSFDNYKVEKGSTISSTIEFNKCLNIITRSRPDSRIKLAGPDRLLFAVQVGPYRNSIISLSPSDEAVLNFDAEISSLITQYGPSNRKIIPNEPNLTSVAVIVQLGHYRALLGADLEVHPSDKNIGWEDVVSKSQVLDKYCTYFKIPHHGSINAFHQGLWDNFLDSPISTITPWSIGSKLPQQNMLTKYKGLSKELYITATKNPPKPNPKKRDKYINKLIEDLKLNIKEVPFSQGIIRSRISMTENDSQWEVDCYEAATKIS